LAAAELHNNQTQVLVLLFPEAVAELVMLVMAVRVVAIPARLMDQHHKQMPS
jgi:hypothetical protein